jgi:hypothetical protein
MALPWDRSQKFGAAVKSESLLMAFLDTAQQLALLWKKMRHEHR